jgi:hypothetical protein
MRMRHKSDQTLPIPVKSGEQLQRSEVMLIKYHRSRCIGGDVMETTNESLLTILSPSTIAYINAIFFVYTM